MSFLTRLLLSSANFQKVSIRRIGNIGCSALYRYTATEFSKAEWYGLLAKLWLPTKTQPIIIIK
jgi:hypothetical protein